MLFSACDLLPICVEEHSLTVGVVASCVPCSLLSEENTMTCSLESVVSTYRRHFSRQDSYRVGSALVVLLRLRDLLSAPSQRLAALAVLHELYRSDSFVSNPFALFFVELLQPTMEEGHTQAGASTTERWFLTQILSPSFPREVSLCIVYVLVWFIFGDCNVNTLPNNNVD